MSNYVEKLFDPLEFEIKNLHGLLSEREKKRNPSIIPKMEIVRKVLLQVCQNLSRKKQKNLENV